MASGRKIENIAVALPLFGAAMILPPIVSVFAADARLMGVPVIVFYLFSVWLFFIGGTFLLSRKLKFPANSASDADSGGMSGSG